MSEEQYLLICLIEECAEVSQRATKALRFGMSEVQPEQELSNRQRLAIEFDDLLAVQDALVSRGLLRPISTQAIKVKMEKLSKYMAYSREQGVLK